MRAHFSPGLSGIQVKGAGVEYKDYSADFKGHEWVLLNRALAFFANTAPDLSAYDSAVLRDMTESAKRADR